MNSHDYINKLKGINKDAINDIGRELIEAVFNKKFMEAAQLYEVYGTIGIYIECADNYNAVNADMLYMYSRCIHIACLYHYAYGDKEYALALSKINYDKHYRYYKELLNPKSTINKSYKEGDYVAHDLELLGDICIFIDHELSHEYYLEAKKLYEVSDAYDSDWYLGIDEDYRTALKNCFNHEVDRCYRMPERMNLKRKLYNYVILDKQLNK